MNIINNMEELELLLGDKMGIYNVLLNEIKSKDTKITKLQEELNEKNLENKKAIAELSMIILGN